MSQIRRQLRVYILSWGCHWNCNRNLCVRPNMVFSSLVLDHLHRTVFVVLAVLSLIRMRQRRLAQKANLAFIRNSQAQQAQQGSYYAGPSPYQQPNYMPNNTPTQTYYPPPPGPPRDVKGHEGPPYDPTNAPQPPPPTYSV